jgi:hypothetical protein
VVSKGSNDILSELAQSLYFKYKEQLSVLQWKNIIRKVVDITSKYDNTIDTNINFEVIRKNRKEWKYILQMIILVTIII